MEDVIFFSQKEKHKRIEKTKLRAKQSFENIGKGEKTMKRIVTSLLLLTLLLAMAIVPGYAQATPVAEWVGKSQVAYPVTPDDILVEARSRGRYAPTEFWDLSDDDYHASSDGFYTAVFTNYYFKPNSDGEIYVSASFRWVDEMWWSGAAEKTVSLECFEKDSHTKVAEWDLTDYVSTDGYLRTGKILFHYLDTEKEYYFRFVRRHDGYATSLNATVSHD